MGLYGLLQTQLYFLYVDVHTSQERHIWGSTAFYRVSLTFYMCMVYGVWCMVYGEINDRRGSAALNTRHPSIHKS
jgi:hypothetical protein